MTKYKYLFSLNALIYLSLPIFALFPEMTSYLFQVAPFEGHRLDSFQNLMFAVTPIGLMYVFAFIGSFFGFSISVFDPTNGSLLSIGISLAVIAIASLNLVLDFDFIEEGAEKGAPKYMEWYGAFGLLVTLVWLYLEILRLLAKLNSRK